ncbi:site-specific DNA-methyltransferase [Fusobacterium necrophorum]|uniref:Site-specific DNA-methyltransferase n=1 Tax=Fusobacterium necrophorum TaxID=859 RepID=A0A4Q2KUV9_9FUSO|nr:site-specific DNA-methyltransferase [Fusobacterium necrophorum]RXZ68597.1 site-specific DNA-methyltransferase [Fusobacterium necrophorum]
MGNLSQTRRAEMLEYLNHLKEIHTDDESRIALGKIETALTEKKYGLVWEEHEEEVDKKLVHNIPVFREVEAKKIVANENEDFNFLLEGDNLHSLKLLEKTHKGKVDVIYIDPPYNTGNKDFIYDDNYIGSDDGYRHSKWLSFMNERLTIARELLTDDGFILISIDESESSQLKILCDDIFGENNFQTTLHIQVRYAQKSLTEEKDFKPVMEYVFLYSKDYKQFNPKRKEEEYTDEKFIYKINELSKGEDFYIGKQKVTVFKKGEWELEKMEEGSLNGLKETWISGTIYTKMSYGQVFKSVVEPRISEDGLSCLYKVHGRGEDGLGYRYYTGPQRKNAKRGKMYSGMPLNRVEEIKSGKSIRFKPLDTFFDFAADFGNINHEGGVTFNSGKKPVKMLKSFIDFSQNNSGVILDYFAGSGTTGQAVMQLNKEDGGNRKYILCTNNENNICEKITYKRIKNIQKELPHNLKYYKTEFIPKLSEDEEILSSKLLGYIKEMVELENMCEIDGITRRIILSDEDLNIALSEMEESGVLYIPSFILLTNEIKDSIEERKLEVVTIPDYYFTEELREVNEL